MREQGTRRRVAHPRRLWMDSTRASRGISVSHLLQSTPIESRNDRRGNGVRQICLCRGYSDSATPRSFFTRACRASSLGCIHLSRAIQFPTGLDMVRFSMVDNPCHNQSAVGRRAMALRLPSLLADNDNLVTATTNFKRQAILLTDALFVGPLPVNRHLTCLARR